jgi:hypothetical protein
MIAGISWEAAKKKRLIKTVSVVRPYSVTAFKAFFNVSQVDTPCSTSTFFCRVGRISATVGPCSNSIIARNLTAKRKKLRK